MTTTTRFSIGEPVHDSKYKKIQKSCEDTIPTVQLRVFSQLNVTWHKELGEGGCGGIYPYGEEPNKVIKVLNLGALSDERARRELVIPITTNLEDSQALAAAGCVLPKSVIILRSLGFVTKLKKLEGNSKRNLVLLAIGLAILATLIFVCLTKGRGKNLSQAQYGEIGGGSVVLASAIVTSIAAKHFKGSKYKALLEDLDGTAKEHLCYITNDVPAASNLILGVTMDKVEGRDLKAALESDTKRVNGKDFLGMFGQAAKGIGAMHDKGFLHRDIKPANLLLNKEGKVKICDFGTAVKLKEGASVIIDNLEGSYGYLAPEIINFKNGNAKYSKASDVYAFGNALALGVRSAEELSAWRENKFPPNEELEGLRKQWVVRQAKANEGRMSDLTEAQRGSVRNLIADMKDENPEDRPTMKEVHEALEIIQNYPEVKYDNEFGFDNYFCGIMGMQYDDLTEEQKGSIDNLIVHMRDENPEDRPTMERVGEILNNIKENPTARYL